MKDGTAYPVPHWHGEHLASSSQHCSLVGTSFPFTISHSNWGPLDADVLVIFSVLCQSMVLWVSTGVLELEYPGWFSSCCTYCSFSMGLVRFGCSGGINLGGLNGQMTDLV